MSFIDSPKDLLQLAPAHSRAKRTIIPFHIGYRVLHYSYSCLNPSSLWRGLMRDAVLAKRFRELEITSQAPRGPKRQRPPNYLILKGQNPQISNRKIWKKYHKCFAKVFHSSQDWSSPIISVLQLVCILDALYVFGTSCPNLENLVLSHSPRGDQYQLPRPIVSLCLRYFCRVRS